MDGRIDDIEIGESFILYAISLSSGFSRIDNDCLDCNIRNVFARLMCQSEFGVRILPEFQEGLELIESDVLFIICIALLFDDDSTGV